MKSRGYIVIHFIIIFLKMGPNWRYLLRLSRLLKDELFEMLQDYPKEFFQKIDQVYDLPDPKMYHKFDAEFEECAMSFELEFSEKCLIGEWKFKSATLYKFYTHCVSRAAR